MPGLALKYSGQEPGAIKMEMAFWCQTPFSCSHLAKGSVRFKYILAGGKFPWNEVKKKRG